MQWLDPTGYPMMAENEVKIIDDLIEKYKPTTCLEWGSGNSTIYFPKQHPCIVWWDAVEHDHTYLELLGDKIDKTRTKITILPNDNLYVEFPVGKKYDFILVDGKQREACIDMAFKVANKGAIILLHDYTTKEAYPIVKKYSDRIIKLSEGELLQKDGFYAHRGLALFKSLDLS